MGLTTQGSAPVPGPAVRCRPRESLEFRVQNPAFDCVPSGICCPWPGLQESWAKPKAASVTTAVSLLKPRLLCRDLVRTSRDGEGPHLHRCLSSFLLMCFFGALSSVPQVCYHPRQHLRVRNSSGAQGGGESRNRRILEALDTCTSIFTSIQSQS